MSPSTDEGLDAQSLLQELESQPLEEQLTAGSTYQLVAESAARTPSQPALVYLNTGLPEDPPLVVTYEQLLKRIRQTANALHRLGVGENDVVSLLLPHFLEAHEVFWGSETAGIVNPINFLLRTEEIVDLMNAAQSKILVCPGPHPALEIWQKVLAIGAQVPSLTHILQIPLGPQADLDAPEGLPTVLDFRQVRDAESGDRLNMERSFDDQTTAAFFHTGGTTGSPKLARHLHRNQVYNAWAFGKLFSLSEQDVVLNGLPVFHVAGALVCGLAPLAAGSTIVILSAAGLRSPTIVSEYWRIAERWKATVLGGVPTSLAALNQVPINSDLTHANSAITGASPLPLDVGKTFQERTGLPLHQIYGMTETAGILALSPRYCHDPLETAGYRLPFSKVEVRRLDQGSVTESCCEPSEPGMVVVSGPNVFPGYLDPAHNEGCFTSDGFLITGDLGHITEKGLIFLTGRAKDVIIRGGHNIDPQWIEDAALAHPSVDAAAAVGRPDDYAGEIPVLFVTEAPDEKVDLDELARFVQEHIAERPARPQKITVLPAIPTTAVGKPFRPELRRLAAEDHLRHVVSEATLKLQEEGEDAPQVELTVTLDSGGLKAMVQGQGESAPDFVSRILNAYTLRWSWNEEAADT